MQRGVEGGEGSGGWIGEWRVERECGEGSGMSRGEWNE